MTTPIAKPARLGLIAGNGTFPLLLLDAARAQGIEVIGPEQKGPGMDKTIEFPDLDGNKIQFYCDMDQIGWDDRSRPPEEWRRQKIIE